MTLTQLVNAVLSRGFKTCEPKPITFEESGSKYQIPANGTRYALHVTGQDDKPVPFAWVDVSPKGNVSGMESASYRASHGFAAVHGDLYKANAKTFRAFVDGKKDDSAVNVIVPIIPVDPAVSQAEALSAV